MQNSALKKTLKPLLRQDARKVLTRPDLQLDRHCEAILKRASLEMGLRTSRNPVNDDDLVARTQLDLLQSTIIGYRKSDEQPIKVISGVFSVHSYLQLDADQQGQVEVPILILEEAPNVETRQFLLLNELTRSLLRQCFVSKSPQLAEYLCKWFAVNSSAELFSSSDWLALFPTLRTKAELCRWLEISPKTFIYPQKGN